MQNFDELGRVIRDRHVRYRHEAYQARLASHPIRRWIGSHVIQFGESIQGHVGVQTPPSAIDQTLR